MAPADLRGAPWFRLDPVLDGDGALAGQRLLTGLDGERTARSMDLAAESFAAGPFGGVVLVGSDDGATSRLLAIDIARGCAWISPTSATSSGAPRSTRPERSSTRCGSIAPAVPTSASGDARSMEQPRAGSSARRRPTPRFGRTFSTEFTWDVAGDRLAVQSCGERACRIRVIAPGGGPTVTLDDPELGQIVGLDGDVAMTYEACRGLPCPIVATDVRTGDRRVVAPAAGLAIVIPTADGTRLVHEVGGGTTRRLVSVTPEWPAPAGSRVDPRRPPAPPICRPRRRRHERADRLGPARSRWPTSGRRQHRPPAAPPRPGRLDRPAR